MKCCTVQWACYTAPLTNNGPTIRTYPHWPWRKSILNSRCRHAWFISPSQYNPCELIVITLRVDIRICCTAVVNSAIWILGSWPSTPWFVCHWGDQPRWKSLGFSPHLCVGFLFLILYPGLLRLLLVLLPPPAASTYPNVTYNNFTYPNLTHTNFTHTNFTYNNFTYNNFYISKRNIQ